MEKKLGRPRPPYATPPPFCEKWGFARIFRQFRPLIESFHLDYRLYLTELIDLSLKRK